MSETTHDGDAAIASRASLPSRLRAALGAPGDVGTLRDVVCRYVDAARARGEPIERVIIDLKQELRAAGAIDRYASKEERALGEGVVRWCIERYYGAAELPERGP